MRKTKHRENKLLLRSYGAKQKRMWEWFFGQADARPDSGTSECNHPRAVQRTFPLRSGFGISEFCHSPSTRLNTVLNAKVSHLILVCILLQSSIISHHIIVQHIIERRFSLF